MLETDFRFGLPEWPEGTPIQCDSGPGGPSLSSLDGVDLERVVARARVEATGEGPRRSLFIPATGKRACQRQR